MIKEQIYEAALKTLAASGNETAKLALEIAKNAALIADYETKRKNAIAHLRSAISQNSIALAYCETNTGDITTKCTDHIMDAIRELQ